MKKTYSLLILVLTISGCSAEKEISECIYDVNKTILLAGSKLKENYISRIGGGVESIEKNLTLLCMNGKGWK
jgi:hypothetical protein